MPPETNGVHDSCLLRQDHAHRHNGAAGLMRKGGTSSAASEAFNEQDRRTEAWPVVPRMGPARTWYLPLKRLLDVVGVLLLALPTLLILFVAGMLVKLTSHGPMLYSQIRVGRNGRRFTIWKLRSMVHDCERETGPRWATALDARITPIGRLLRKTHIDELPQLWNVLRGEMSLVGPRPERPEFVPLLAEVIPDYQDRLAVQPGMTGLAQVQLRPDTDIDSVQRKLKYDLWYVSQCSLGLDLRILATTVYYLAQVSYDRVAAWLRVPDQTLVEAEHAPAILRPLLPRPRSQDTQVLPETRVVVNGRLPGP